MTSIPEFSGHVHNTGKFPAETFRADRRLGHAIFRYTGSGHGQISETDSNAVHRTLMGKELIRTSRHGTMDHLPTDRSRFRKSNFSFFASVGFLRSEDLTVIRTELA